MLDIPWIPGYKGIVKEEKTQELSWVVEIFAPECLCLEELCSPPGHLSSRHLPQQAGTLYCFPWYSKQNYAILWKHCYTLRKHFLVKSVTMMFDFVIVLALVYDSFYTWHLTPQIGIFSSLWIWHMLFIVACTFHKNGVLVWPR